MRRLLVIAVVLFAGTACASSGAAPRVKPVPAVNATRANLLPKTTNGLPSFTFADMRQLLSELHGTPVLLNVWGSWCGPCREEGPRLAAAARTYGRRVQFLGLDVRDEVGPARRFVEQMRWTYPSVFDPSPNASVEIQLGWRAQPVTLFFDRSGKIVDQVSGPVTAAELASGIGKILT
jgi:thiol-disulfide isomerase/thioredoxin